MAKQIKTIHEITLAEDGNNYSIHTLYTVLDNNDNMEFRKGRTIKQIGTTQLQKDKFKSILQIVVNKLKYLEDF